MGDWERTFGAGTSAESVISWINSHRDEGPELGGDRHGAATSSLAFHGDETLKLSLMGRLRLARERGLFVGENRSFEPGRGSFSRLGNTAEDAYTNLENEYALPAELIMIADAVFSDSLAWWSPRHEFASSWPIRFINALRVGTDLRLIAPKLAAFVLEDVMRFKELEYWRDVMAPALAVAECRGRGVIVHKEIALGASRTALIGLDEILPYESDSERARYCAALAAKPTGSSAESVWNGVSARAGIYTAGDYFEAWLPYIKQLRSLIDSAPCEPVEVIDLNDPHLSEYGARRLRSS